MAFPGSSSGKNLLQMGLKLPKFGDTLINESSSEEEGESSEKNLLQMGLKLSKFLISESSSEEESSSESPTPIRRCRFPKLKRRKRIAKPKYGRTTKISLCDEIKMTIQNKGNINKYSSIRAQTSYLIVACQQKDIKSVKLLLEHNCDINIVNESGRTALIYAVETGNIEIVKLLLKYNSDINIGDKFGKTPFIHAVRYGHIDIIKFLIKNSHKINQKDRKNKTALMHAIELGCTEIVDILLRTNKYNINDQDKLGQTALMKAVNADKIEIVIMLLERNCNIFIKDHEKNTAITMSTKNSEIFHTLQKYYTGKLLTKLFFKVIKRRNIEPLRILLKRKDLDKNIGAKCSIRRLQKYRIINDHKLMKEIIKLGYDINSQNKYGNTILHHATPHLKMINLLLNNGKLNINIKNKKLETPLHYCAKRIRHYEYISIIRSLIKRSRNYNDLDKNGKTFLDIIPKKYLYDIKLLIRRQYLLPLFKQCILYIENNLSKFNSEHLSNLNRDIRKKFHIKIKY